MAWKLFSTFSFLATRVAHTDPNAAADINSVDQNIEDLKGNVALMAGSDTQPPMDLTTIAGKIYETSTGNIKMNGSVSVGSVDKIPRSDHVHPSDTTRMVAGVYALTDGATIAIDWNNGSTQYVTLGSTGRTVTFANPVAGMVYRFIIIQGSGGSKTITTWPTIKWSGGSAPTLTATAGQADIVTLIYVNGNYYADCSKNF